MGTGDWNDGMNLVGEGGERGKRLARLAADAHDRRCSRRLPRARPERAARWQAHAASPHRPRRAKPGTGRGTGAPTFDDGSLARLADGDECRIDSHRAVLGGPRPARADPERAAAAMAAAERHLIRRPTASPCSLHPPFDRTPLDPGYIKGYPPGLRENGGQYSHAAMWAILAFARMGQRRSRACTISSPCSTRSPMQTRPKRPRRYKVEPYVVAADVYSVAPHVGRGGWTWYTGSAAWMYRAGIEGILGLRREGGRPRPGPVPAGIMAAGRGGDQNWATPATISRSEGLPIDQTARPPRRWTARRCPTLAVRYVCPWMVAGMFWCSLYEVVIKLESCASLEFITIQTVSLVLEACLPDFRIHLR
jgi:cellobiose phosphorylase